MQQKTPPTFTKLDELFNRGWPTVISRTLGVSRRAIYEMKSPTRDYLGALAEFFETVDPRDWPDRWSDLRQLTKMETKQ